MKNFDEIISRFDQIQDLPVSEEMLGAYMENNLDFIDTSLVESAIYSNESLNDLLEVITLSQNEISDFEDLIPYSDINAELPEEITQMPFVLETSSILDGIAEFSGFSEVSLDLSHHSHLNTDNFLEEFSSETDSFPCDSHSINTNSSNDDETQMENTIDF